MSQKENTMSNTRQWLESACDYLQVVQQTYEEKYRMYDEGSSNENLIAMIQAQDNVLLNYKGYKPHDVESLLTYERPTLIEMVIRGGDLIDLMIENKNIKKYYSEK
jgi:hypothetical protein